jgi:hypothetical protein
MKTPIDDLLTATVEYNRSKSRLDSWVKVIPEAQLRKELARMSKKGIRGEVYENFLYSIKNQRPELWHQIKSLTSL